MNQEFNKKHITLKQIVKDILKHDKQARKDYFYLCLLVWLKSNQIQLIVPMKDYSKLYKPDSITRISRELFIEARKGVPDLQFLLKDTETLDKRSNLENLNHQYYQEEKLSNQAFILK